mmetsp:Transcript_9712/g.18147  ORF Transcript_9712/g.18147 Transcript_9712/m.18147 type:complete len:425 (-) Transcript_9712:282-1556(-)|eukprot:CAMPEP_0175072932 /NCGR_PEP_ID=MMETSP0052_2-20121109/20223_1 /TAXON_ID=51329 ORGANISM="Polytomella parva, Strain SAG 63-3" /NCGR_SAMPLE_ID=MMETSP0052_2 /ASSEMBLY_ACC=CAM_ASM_000194 /LENGTH=424 /DNA_ID=CAMNT_0016340569 /DNA_START=75 /DNA_END=1349 /DNA_ORIENTATION=-
MGACASSPQAKYAENSSPPKSTPKPQTTTKQASPTQQAKKSSTPDFGLSTNYDVIKLLGRGGEGETWLCRDKTTDIEVAVKLIKRPIPKPAIAVIKREIKIQADLGQGHLNIVSADKVVLTKSHLGLIMEYVPGGNMVNFVTKRRDTKNERAGLCIDEDEARFFFRQLISAVDYCHRNHVAHRDLKLDNTLLDNHDPSWVKLCDFGFAKHWNTNSNMDTMRIGTPEYMGPELISSRSGYDGKKVDVWAAGVLLYVMLVGMFPFETSDDNFNNTAGLYDIWLQQIKTNWRDAAGTSGNGGVSTRLSHELKELLDKMFEVKQDARISVEGIKNHPWFNKPLPSRYAEALNDLNEAQHLIDEQVAKGAYTSAERDKALDALLDKASQAALPTEDILRIDLTRIKRPLHSGSRTPMAATGMSTLAEEE